MSHEATHVATDAALSTMPLWLLEGFADYVALRDVDLPIVHDGRADHPPGPAQRPAGGASGLRRVRHRHDAPGRGLRGRLAGLPAAGQDRWRGGAGPALRLGQRRTAGRIGAAGDRFGLGERALTAVAGAPVRLGGVTPPDRRIAIVVLLSSTAVLVVLGPVAGPVATGARWHPGPGGRGLGLQSRPDRPRRGLLLVGAALELGLAAGLAGRRPAVLGFRRRPAPGRPAARAVVGAGGARGDGAAACWVGSSRCRSRCCCRREVLADGLSNQSWAASRATWRWDSWSRPWPPRSRCCVAARCRHDAGRGPGRRWPGPGWGPSCCSAPSSTRCVVEPLFNSFTPLPDGSLRTEILRLADTEGVHVDDVLVADASRRTTTLNAYVSGFGSTRRVVVYDNSRATTCPRTRRSRWWPTSSPTPGTATCVVGSVLGATRSSVRGSALLALLVGVAAAGERRRLGMARSRRGAAGAGAGRDRDAAGESGARTPSAAQIETRADVDALRGDPRPGGVHRDAAGAVRALAGRPDATPACSQFWFGSHPTALARVALAEAMRRAGPERPRRRPRADARGRRHWPVVRFLLSVG